MNNPKQQPRAAAILAALLALLAACAGAPPTPQARQAYITELTEAYDIEGIVSRSQAEALADAHRSLERARSQYSEALARLSPAQQEKLSAAMDRFVTATRGMPDLDEATAVWTQAFLANLTEEDLQKIVQFSRTPAGRAQIAGNRDAAEKLRAYLAQQRVASIDKAEQQYLAELRAIAGSSK